MAVDNPDVIDLVIADDRSTSALLVISDHLRWTTEMGEATENDLEHAYALEEKLKSYLQFVESGQLKDEFPKTIGKPIVFLVTCKFPLNQWAEEFYSKLQTAVIGAGFSLRQCDGELFQATLREYQPSSQ